MAGYLTGSEATVAQLVAEGVEVILSIPGEHNLSLCDSVLDFPQLRFITGRHEQGIAFIADGYARASGKVAVPIVISGPGVTNSITPLADAYLDSVPMVLIATQSESHRLGKGAFHELKDQTGLLASVTKWNTRVERVEEVPDAIRTAFVQAYSGRPGPTAVEIPLDVQAQRGQVDIYPSARPERRRSDPDAACEAARLLSAATSPLVYVGRGAALSECTAELIQLIEHLNAPCFTTALAKGTIRDDHPLTLGWGGDQYGLVHQFLEDADVVLVIGSSLDEADTERLDLAFPETLIQIDTCSDVIGRKYPVCVGLAGDAKAVLNQLLAELANYDQAARLSPAEHIAEHKQRALGGVQHKLAWQFMNAIQQALPRDAFVTNDASQTNGWVLSFLERHSPNTISITRNLAALGYAFPAALGAKLAYPERQAMAVVGDGGFLFTIFTLATAVQHRINAVAIVFNDESYSTIRRIQTQRFGRTIGVDLRGPDHVRLAEAYGAAGARSENPDQLYDALMAAWQRDVPTIIDVPLDENIDYL